MSDDGVCPGFRHGFRFLRSGNVDDGKDVHLACQCDGIDFFLNRHAGFLKCLAEVSVDDGVGGEVVHTGEAHIFDFKKVVPHAAARVGAVDTADHRDFVDDGEDLELADFHGDGIGVIVGHQSAG